MFKQSQPERVLDWPNVGKATAEDLELLGVKTLEDLKSKNADELYKALNVAKGTRCDPCCWDVFASLVHYAKTGERRKWWEFTPERKSRAEPV